MIIKGVGWYWSDPPPTIRPRLRLANQYLKFPSREIINCYNPLIEFNRLKLSNASASWSGRSWLTRTSKCSSLALRCSWTLPTLEWITSRPCRFPWSKSSCLVGRYSLITSTAWLKYFKQYVCVSRMPIRCVRKVWTTSTRRPSSTWSTISSIASWRTKWNRGYNHFKGSLL